MKTPQDENHDLIDALVSAHLNRQAATIDANAGLARVRSAMRPVVRFSSWRPRLALAAGIAASIVFLLLCGPATSPAQASSRELVEQARRTHQLPLERCYSVELRRNDLNVTLGKTPRLVRVWTAGDRFWVETRHEDAEPFFVWGREPDGALWAVLGPNRGVRVSAEQAPRPLALLADVYSLNLDTLLDQVLRDCSIRETSRQVGTRVVRAEPRSERMQRWLSHVSLEIDTDAKVVQRLAMVRERQGGTIEAVFTLIESRPVAGEKYRLESHLARPFRIHEGNIEPGVKLDLVTRWLGGKPVQRPLAKVNPKTETPKPAKFEDISGKSHTPLAQAGMKATVLFFVMPDCPISNAYAPEIERICVEYAKKKVGAYIVHADPDVTVEQAKKHAKDYALSAPVLLDPTHALVKATKVTTAPEVAVVAEGKVVYHGRIDDWYVDYGKRRGEPTKRDLRDTLDAVLAGKPVPNATVKALGCILPEPRK